ncbi:sigma-54-dependent Fis family transcriptional regulator [Oxalobacteraceae bacterium]|nr:sigma-54-dependent Fis family transcriptional regulator [Oxalobacteraceae bacterium]
MRQWCARAQVLALASAAAAPPAPQLWQCLAAGAADVQWWPATAAGTAGAVARSASARPPSSLPASLSASLPTSAPVSLPAAALLARLRRWHAVETLLRSPIVSQCLVGASARWQTLVREVVEVAALTQSPVLITGETGTGKDLIAQTIHRLSGCKGDFTVLDCTTLSPELCGSELFGHERGAFTGAAAARDGAFALADGGLLFLDEVGELPLPLQAQLLRAIQERKYKRLGSNSWQPTQFRLVCATNRELETEVAQGRFRADLYYRIAAWRCRTPPLRERREDIPALASHFLRELAPPGSCCEFDPALAACLLARDYPGNVRELRQTVARIWHRHCGVGPVTVGALPPEDRPACDGGDAGWLDAAFETAIRHALAMGAGLTRISQVAADVAIRIVLDEENGSNQRAALRLGVTDRALQIRRKRGGESES